MGKIFKWLFEEDGYYTVITIIILAFFGLGAFASFCDKEDDEMIEYKREKSERIQEKNEHRAAFYEKYNEVLPQANEKDFSYWLDDTDYESIALLHTMIVLEFNDYSDEDGFQRMIEYLHWRERDRVFPDDY